ncbi:DMT family transporter [Acinetobacter sp. MD2]|uniref:DMT family transporter n=1 Tax=Acinetobacter sp. MD2 TaxID=2600066 RepID=UPI002D1F4029|nr:DMT family transporter [Acinetobacter sp. MD2]MEB3766826.1 DMT family transporter [Acinetobacter sp. MD2]
MQSKLNGWLSGLIGVLIFSGSLPATRVALAAFSPTFLTVGRASFAGCLALICLILLKQAKPNWAQLQRLSIVTLGVVIGFPFCTSMALQSITAAYSVVFVGILPLATALFAVLKGEQRPQPKFWFFAILGSSVVVLFAFTQNTHAQGISGQSWMFAAIILCGLGYAEGGKLARELGGWQVISWALVLALPVMLPLSYYFFPIHLGQAPLSAIIGLGYVSMFSMFIGFIFWYHGLATAGVIGVGQLQLIQPFFGLILCTLLLHETVSLGMVISAVLVMICVVYAKKFAHIPTVTMQLKSAE